jgi:hypothetical protein
MTVRKISRFALVTACLAVLSVTVVAQNQGSKKPHHTANHSANHSRQKPVSQVLPRSLPNSAVPQASGAKVSAPNQELARMERSSVSHIRPATQKNAHAASVASHPSVSHERSTPMNFSYQARHGNTKTNSAPTASRKH